MNDLLKYQSYNSQCEGLEKVNENKHKQNTAL